MGDVSKVDAAGDHRGKVIENLMKHALSAGNVHSAAVQGHTAKCASGREHSRPLNEAEGIAGGQY
jgi:hypothetical protein